MQRQISAFYPSDSLKIGRELKLAHQNTTGLIYLCVTPKLSNITTWIIGFNWTKSGCDKEGIGPFVIWIHPLHYNKSNFVMPFLKIQKSLYLKE